MKFTLLCDTSHDALALQLAPALRTRLRATPAPGPTYTAILFAMGDRPVRGRLAERAVAQATDRAPGTPLVVVAEALTQEALAVLHACRATIVSAGEFMWTDASSEWVRAISAAGPRAPDVRGQSPKRTPPDAAT